MTAKRLAVLVLASSCLLGLPQTAGAFAIANSTLDFKNLAIAPTAGTFSLDGPWSLEAGAQANNSLGESAGNFSPGTSPGAVNAAAPVTWASASGNASALADPPNLVVTGFGKSNVNVPGCGPAAAFSKGRGTLFNFFTLSATGNVKFDIDVSGLLQVMTDICGIEAATEVIFSLEVDGVPILFHDSPLAIGRSSTAVLPIATHLTNTVMLDSGSHFLLLEADSESRGLVDVSEPPAGLLLIAGLVMLMGLRGHRFVVRRRVA